MPTGKKPEATNGRLKLWRDLVRDVVLVVLAVFVIVHETLDDQPEEILLAAALLLLGLPVGLRLDERLRRNGGT